MTTRKTTAPTRGSQTHERAEDGRGISADATNRGWYEDVANGGPASNMPTIFKGWALDQG